MEKKIKVYTDGSCLGNPGPGGWGVVILHEDKEVHLKGGEKDTTNNRMEMMAIIHGLKYLHDKKLTSSTIELYSDSNLLMQSLIQGWKRKANLDLWKEIDTLLGGDLFAGESLNIKWIWVKGHASNKYNNLADQLAVEASKKVQKGKYLTPSSQ